MFVAAMRFEIRIPAARSLKEKRAALRPAIERLRRDRSLSVAEVGGQDTWQSATIGVAAVARRPGELDEWFAQARRILDRFPDLEVVTDSIAHLEVPE